VVLSVDGDVIGNQQGQLQTFFAAEGAKPWVSSLSNFRAIRGQRRLGAEPTTVVDEGGVRARPTQAS
jgi:hypothetical protein